MFLLPEVDLSKPGSKLDLSKQAVPESVLIVDGDKALLTMIKNHVKNLGVQKVECFSDGWKAIETLKTTKFDLVILDWKLKHPSGNEFYEFLRDTPNTKMTQLILISGFVTKAD